MADAEEGSGTTAGLVIREHLPISVPIAVGCGLLMWVAARVQLMVVTRRRQPNPQRTDARGSDETSEKPSAAAEKAASALTASRDEARRLQRRIDIGTKVPMVSSLVIFMPLALLGSRIFPPGLGFLGGLFCGLASFSIGLAIVGSPPADSRSIRAKVHRRVFFYHPLVFTAFAILAVDQLLRWAVMGAEEGADPVFAASYAIVMLSSCVLLAVATSLFFVPLLYPTKTPMPHPAQLISTQRARLTSQVGEARARVLQRPLMPAWYPPYLLEGAGYYEVAASRTHDIYMDVTGALFLFGFISTLSLGVSMYARGSMSFAAMFTVVFGCGGGQFAVGLMMIRPVRRRLQRWLVRLGGAGARREAAAVAALMGNVSPADALSMGRRSFRGLPVASIGADDLGSSADSGMFQKTKAAALGELDAFVSHSWHDDGAKKYKGLRGWADAFEAREKRAPLIWLDKASIDQTDISTALACLPVYLAGCRELLILAGPTYVERLWCVVEVYTYLRMGGKLDGIEVVALDAAALPSFGEFKAEDAKCYSAEDKAKLLGAIENGFGSTAPFNELVRSTLSLQRRAEAVVEVAEEEADPDVVHMRGYKPPADPTLEC